MSHSIIGIGGSTTQIETAVQALHSRCGVEAQNVSVLIPDNGQIPHVGVRKTTKAPEGTTAGVMAGGATGGAIGLLVGVGALVIPGLGPFIAAGPLVAALSGAAAGAALGGITGALVGMGIPELEARAYERRIKDGGYLLAVHCTEGTKDAEIRKVLKQHDFQDIAEVDEK